MTSRWLLGAWLVVMGCKSAPTTAPSESTVGAAREDARDAAIVDAAVEDAEPDAASLWRPSGSACRTSVHAAKFADVSDAVIATAMLRRYDAATNRLRTSREKDEMVAVRDCRGDRVAFEEPDAAAISAGVRIQRFDERDARVAVFATVAMRNGYYVQCAGFAAIVRLDRDEIIVEGIDGMDLYECDQASSALHLVPLGDQDALLFPVPTGSGESGDESSVWQVYVPSTGVLKRVGHAARDQNAGNGTLGSGKWFATLETKVRGGGAFQIDETWKFDRYDPDGTTAAGPRRSVVRTYTLGPDGGLERTPRTDPTLTHDAQ